MCMIRLTGFLAGDGLRLGVSGSSTDTSGWLVRRWALGGSAGGAEMKYLHCYCKSGRLNSQSAATV